MEIDNLLDEAIEFSKKEGRIRVTTLQIRFKLGYNRASRLMQMMEEIGVLDEMNKGVYWFDREVKQNIKSKNN